MTASGRIAAEKRQHIIETAYVLFKRFGYHATGIDRIIDQAQVAKMTMYRHFPTKDELIVAVLRYRAERFDAELDRLAEAAPTLEAKIGGILDWYEHWFRSADFHGCLHQHALAEFGDPAHPAFAAVAEHKAGVERRLRRILEEATPRDRAGHAAASLFMLLEGATLLAQMGRGGDAIGTVRRAVPAVIAMSEDAP